MFQGSKHVPGDSHFKHARRRPAAATSTAPPTSIARTTSRRCRRTSSSSALWLESDRMGYLLDQVDQANLSNQQDVVRNERRQSVENQPYGIVEEALFHQLFPKDHPVLRQRDRIARRHPGGEARRREELLQAVLRAEQRQPRDRRRHRQGGDQGAGREVLRHAQAGHSRCRSRPCRRRRSRPSAAPVVTGPRRAAARLHGVAHAADLQARRRRRRHRGDRARRRASRAGSTRSSSTSKQIAQDVSAHAVLADARSVFQITATARPGHTAEELEKAIDEELARFRESGPDQTEVERARNVIETRIVQGLERSGRLRRRRRPAEHVQPLPRRSRLSAEGSSSATATSTPASVKAFAQQQLAADRARRRARRARRAGSRRAGADTPKRAQAAPGTGAESVNADEAWRKEHAEGRPRRERCSCPRRRSFQLPNGLTVLVNERPGLPIVSASLVVKTGSGANPADKPGLANFTAAMLDEGHGDAVRAADRRRSGAARRVARPRRRRWTPRRSSAGSLQRTLPGAARRCWRTSARRPSFPAEEIERQRASRLAQPGAAAREPERRGQSRPWRRRSTARRIRTATPSSAPRRRTRR